MAGTSPAMTGGCATEPGLRRVESLVEVVDQVLRILEADGEAHHLRSRAGLRLLLVRELTVGGGGRVDHQRAGDPPGLHRSEEHTSELQSRQYLVCRLLLEKKK